MKNLIYNQPSRREGFASFQGAHLQISDHLKKHIRPETDNEFGYYLAGLIEGDGFFGDHRFEIAFNKEDIFLAYYIKKKIGYGSVLKLKGKIRTQVEYNFNSIRPIKYILKHTKGLKKVLNLVNGKFLGELIINQILKHGFDKEFDIKLLPPANFDLMTNY